MHNSTHFLNSAPVFHGRYVPEKGQIAGYAALIDGLQLPVPMPQTFALISEKTRNKTSRDWIILPQSYLPEDTQELNEIEALYNHLVFALKYEGVNLLVISFLIRHYSTDQLSTLITIEPSGQYSRRIWFLLEWIMGSELDGMETLSKKTYVPVLDPKHQFALAGIKSPRHKVINNLPGTPYFCPLIHRTEKLERIISADLSKQENMYLEGIGKELLQRASAFLLLKDSKASFTIEGESPKGKRALGWSRAIGQAGTKDLSKAELIRLQQLVIENPRFLDMGLRKKGGFVGEHDRQMGTPMPDHISAKYTDLKLLTDGLLETNKLLINTDMDAVLAAAVVAFGFVFIHPFEDGNGRIHRYIIHHILAKKQFAPQGMIFPVSASILDHIDDYRKVLESYSHPLLDFIEWKETSDHNIEVLNETLDYYRFFDATAQAEFLYDCVQDTVATIIPDEINYLTKYGTFKQYIDNTFEMPDRLVALLVRFLEQNNGKLSKRAKEKEFSGLTAKEITEIERQFRDIFG